MGKIILEKMMLKNWHAFQDIQFDMSDSTLFTGMNASGKTTLLDAISVILDGANSSDFNVAVKDDGERRSISGALHYVVAGEPKRTGKVTGLIMAQFFDEGYNTRFLNGVFLVSKSYTTDAAIDQKFFSVMNSIDDARFNIDFEKCRIPGQINYPNKKTAFEEFFRLRRMQHIRQDVYKSLINSVLKAKLDCTPAEFVRRNMLPEDDKVSSIEMIKNNYKQLDEREGMYAQLSEEAECLKEMREKWFQLKNGETEYMLLSHIKQRILEQQLQGLSSKRNELKRSLNDIKVEKDKLEFELSKLNMKLGEYRSSDVIFDKKKELSILNRELFTLKSELERINKSLLAANVLSNEINKDSKYSKDSSQSDMEELLDDSEKFINGLEDEILELRVAVKKVQSEITDTSQYLVDIKKGKLSSAGHSGVGNRVDAAKDLAKEINARYQSEGIDDCAAPLYELIVDIKDLSWQPAIENLLGAIRTHICVNSENEKLAMEVQNAVAFKDDTDIIFSSKLKEIVPEKNSVASFLQTDNSTATHIINAYYGKYIICEDMKEFDCNEFALMKNGMFKNEAGSHKPIIKTGIEMLLMGENTVKATVADIELDLSKLRHQDYEITKKINQLMDKKRGINKLIANAIVSPVNKDIYAEYEEKMKLSNKLKTEIETLQKFSASNMTNDIKNKIESVKTKITGLDKSKDIMVSEGTKIDSSIQTLEASLIAVGKQLDMIDAKCVTNEQVDEYFHNMADEEKDFNIISKKQTALFNNGKSVSAKIKMIQTDYNMKFAKGLKIGLEIDTYHKYVKRLQYLEGKAVIEIRAEIQKLKASLLESKAGVFRGLAESFQFAMTEVTKINDLLKPYEISGNRFKIRLEPSLRRKDLSQAVTTFANEETISEEVSKCLDGLFDKMVNSKDMNMFKDYADYRNYLDCDVLISHVGTSTWKSFSKEKGNFSGGQKETPYYMCLAAALSCKAYSQGGVRIIILDEAFKNMDQVNKSKALSMFEKLNLQTMIFTSNSDLADCTNRIYVLTKFDNRIIMAGGRNKHSLKVIEKRIQG